MINIAAAVAVLVEPQAEPIAGVCWEERLAG